VLVVYVVYLSAYPDTSCKLHSKTLPASVLYSSPAQPTFEFASGHCPPRPLPHRSPLASSFLLYIITDLIAPRGSDGSHTCPSFVSNLRSKDLVSIEPFYRNRCPRLPLYESTIPSCCSTPKRRVEQLILIPIPQNFCSVASLGCPRPSTLPPKKPSHKPWVSYLNSFSFIILVPFPFVSASFPSLPLEPSAS